MTAAVLPRTAASLRRMLLPLALAQFICSFAGSNMNVMITDISAAMTSRNSVMQTCTPWTVVFRS